MIKVEGTTIKAYRGASGYIRVSKTDDDGNIEQFAANDVITLTVKNNFGESTPILRKQLTVESACDYVDITISATETKSMSELISEPVEFEYDINVNGAENTTIIGHDDSGAKIWKLYPSGSVDE